MGNGATHVANACNETIYVMADAERGFVSMAKFSAGYSGASASGEFHLDWNKIQAGFSRINSGSFLKFNVDMGGKSTVYVSAVTESGLVIANALCKRCDYSVIIGADKQLYDTKYGTIWTDTSGRNHGIIYR